MYIQLKGVWLIVIHRLGCVVVVKLVVLLGFVVLYVVKHVYICLKVILL